MTIEQTDSRDERIGRILNEYLDRAQRGEPVCEADLLAEHPDLADELRAHFGMVRQVQSSRGMDDGGPAVAPPPDALPGYDILGEIHRGGQGVVYEALQKATRRKVAIKVMREGPFGGWRDRARFEREVQILAGLKHPGIVTIHDSGTAAGSHFFVMDYIDGVSPESWLDRTPRPVHQILQVFIRICDAVNQAHLKGIIHRDLKPGNILIDEDDVPHILDFGLAKSAQDEDISPGAGMTIVGQFVGSLPWTSPEQAQGLLDQIDTRTDVYALGVILYQMLTRAFPYDVVGAMRDVLNRIVTSEPIRPSAVIKDVPRDVEAIALKCLQKDSRRRYQTAGELARDIERYLAGQPVAARSDSGLYVLARTLRRYRVPVAVAAAFAALVGVSLLASVSLWRQALTQRDRAVEAQREQQRERERADAKAAEAEQARQAAVQERTRAEAQAEQLRKTTYLNRIALARNAVEQKYLNQARQILAACPEDLRGWEWHYLARLSSESNLWNVIADSGCVEALVVTPDGQRIVTGGCDGVIRLWRTTDGTEVGRLEGHSARILALAISSDGRWLASGARDRTLRLWDLPAAKPARILEQNSRDVNCVAFSPDGLTLVAGGEARVLTFRSVKEGQVLRSSAQHAKQISSVAWSPDGRTVASGELLNPFVGECVVRLWNASTAEAVAELPGPPGAVLALAFSPDSRRLAVGGGTSPARSDPANTLRIYDLAQQIAVLSRPGHEGFVDGLAFSPDGTMIASAGRPRTLGTGTGSDRTLKIWSAETGEELTTYSAHEGGALSVAWSPDSGRIYSAGADGRLKAWPSSRPPDALVLSAHSGAVRRIAFSPDGQRIASVGAQRERDHRSGEPPSDILRVWNAASGAEVLSIPAPDNTVLAMAWSPDGNRIATGGTDGTLHVYETAAAKRALTLPNAGAMIRAVAFSPDGSVLASASAQVVTLWSVPGGQFQRRWSQGDTLVSLMFNSDGGALLIGRALGDIVLVNVSTGEVQQTISTGAPLNGAWFSPDGGRIASAHSDGIIRLWDAGSAQPLATMQGPQRSVEWLAFSPDGGRIASCTGDPTLSLWDVESATEVFNLRAHERALNCVQFDPTGKRIATSGQDGQVKIWDSRPSEPGARSASQVASPP